MKTHLFFCLCLSASLSQAQTAIIAYKSHSGAAVDFFIDPSSNFGNIDLPPESWEHNSIPSKPIETFIPLNDSVILKRTLSKLDLRNEVIKTDTLANRNRYPLFVFLEKYRDSINRVQRALYEKSQLDYQMNLMKQFPGPNKNKNKKKKSYLLFLFGITGAGMLLMRLFRSPKPVQQSIS